MLRIYKIFALAVLSTAAANAHSYHSRPQNYSHLAETGFQNYSNDTRTPRDDNDRSQNEEKAESYPPPDVSLDQGRSSSQSQGPSRNQQNRSSNQSNDDTNDQHQESYQQNNGSANEGQKSNKVNMTVFDIINNNPHFSTFAQALRTSGIIKELEGENELTIFVPSNQAFQRVPPQLLSPENKEKLAKILKHHIIDEIYNRSDLKTDQIEALDGNNLNIEMIGHRIKVDNANIIQTDIKASNGVIHVIDVVLMPENQNQNGSQSR